MSHRAAGALGALFLASVALPTSIGPRSEGWTSTQHEGNTGPFARIAVLRPHDGDSVDFEAGYIRHLDFHRQAKDRWVWYGWSVWAGERQRWFVYATFGHSAASLDNPVPAAEDERDNVANVTPHAEFAGNAVYEYLPRLSRGSGTPTPAPRIELTTVDLEIGTNQSFESAIAAGASSLPNETLWYRLIAGGPGTRYVRLRPRPNLSALLDARDQLPLPAAVDALVEKTTIEILNLRPTMSYGVPTP